MSMLGTTEPRLSPRESQWRHIGECAGGANNDHDVAHELSRRLGSSERQIIKVLPKMARVAHHRELKAGFNKHLAETKEQLTRLDRTLKDLGKDPGRKVCEATMGLIEAGAGVCAVQEAEHYEMATYGCRRILASLLGRDADVKRFDRTLNVEKIVVNAEAVA